jgi:hypothetical protein
MSRSHLVHFLGDREKKKEHRRKHQAACIVFTAPELHSTTHFLKSAIGSQSFAFATSRPSLPGSASTVGSAATVLAMHFLKSAIGSQSIAFATSRPSSPGSASTVGPAAPVLLCSTAWHLQLCPVFAMHHAPTESCLVCPGILGQTSRFPRPAFHSQQFCFCSSAFASISHT